MAKLLLTFVVDPSSTSIRLTCMAATFASSASIAWHIRAADSQSSYTGIVMTTRIGNVRQYSSNADNCQSLQYVSELTGRAIRFTPSIVLTYECFILKRKLVS